MRPLVFLRNTPSIDFMRLPLAGFAFSLVLTVMSVVLFLSVGLNYGIDFVGGVVVDARTTSGPADLADMRAKIEALHLGESSLQGFGSPNDVLIRLSRQPGGDAAQEKAVNAVRQALGTAVEFRRVEVVGPKAGEELIRAGVLATVLARLFTAPHARFRFEAQSAPG